MIDLLPNLPKYISTHLFKYIYRGMIGMMYEIRKKMEETILRHRFEKRLRWGACLKVLVPRRRIFVSMDGRVRSPRAVAPWPCWGVGLVHLSLGFKHFRLGDESNMILNLIIYNSIYVFWDLKFILTWRIVRWILRYTWIGERLNLLSALAWFGAHLELLVS